MHITILILILSILGFGLGMIARFLRGKGLDRWLLPYVIETFRKPRRVEGPVHLIFAIADHFEPKAGNASASVARARIERWIHDYPSLLGGFRDSDGQPPRHTFFYPIEDYEPEHLDLLADLCRAGFGEVEIHLHHDGDTAENLRRTLEMFKNLLSERHGLLPRDRETNELAYGFVHGNWALDNSRPDGRWCGVNNELDILRETGCYADFTLPSAPSPTQTRKINSLYYATDDPHCPKSHDKGIDVGTSLPPTNALLLVQGPLLPDWRVRKWGFLPGIENGCLQESQPPHIDRLVSWLQARVQVPTRPDWFFVKLHCHGAVEESHDVLLGEPMVRFHQDLAELAERDPNFHYHYVTAREMYNLVKAAEAGWQGTVAEARDFRLVWDVQDRNRVENHMSYVEPPST